MDSSADQSVNGTQHTPNPSYSFLDGIESYAGSDPLSNGEDYSQYFDPALFENTTLGHGFAQQPQPVSQNFNQNVSRQSHSPLPQYNAAQPNFSHSQYTQPLYDTRQISQSTYDPRFFSPSSASPAPFDGGYGYQPPMTYNNQNYSSQQMDLPPRQTPTPTANYPARQQQPSPYVNIGPRPSQLSQMQNADIMHYAGFQDQAHQSSSTYVDPTMLTANRMVNTNNNGASFRPHQAYLAQNYFKQGSTVDPRSLQGAQPVQPVGPAPSYPASRVGSVVVPKPEKTQKPKDPHAPRKTKGQGKLKADGQPGSQSDSDDELSIQEEEPPEMTPALLTVSAPTDERGKALYNAVQAVWSPRNKPASPEKIRSGVVGFADTVRALRDAWKAKNDVLRKAELPNSPTAGDAVALKDEVARYRQVTESVMARSLLYGHPSIVKRLGENQFTMAALNSFMLDRVNATDYDSALVSAILKFVVKFETLDSEMLELTKLSKILQRLTKKATTEIKTLAQTVLDNAVAASAKKKASSANPASPNSAGSPADGVRKEVVTGMKRPREGDSASQSVPKKVSKVIQSSKPLALQNAERRKALEAAQAAKAGEKPVGQTIGAGAPAKTKVAVAAPPKQSVFSSLMSASKKPGTSLAARAAAVPKEKVPTAAASSPVPVTTAPSVKKENARKESPPRNSGSTTAPKSNATSSFLGLLADMEKKPEKEPKKEVEVPNETEEEREKRLRKEARRRLRVTWKTDAELVETRIFTHDPDEEIGDGDSLRRDAGDTGREGEALKLHKDQAEFEDDDEDEDSFEEIESYTAPSEVDFSALREESPLVEGNSLKFGGLMKPESPGSEAQDKREQETVMATYTSKADRPPSPKEPDDNEDDDFEPAEPATAFGEPTEKTRQREKEILARQTITKPITNIMPPAMDLAAQIQAMSSGQAPQQPTGPISADLQRVLSALGQQNQPAPQQPAPGSNVDFSALLQSVQQVTQQLQGQSQQPQYPAFSQAPAVAPDLSALLASMQQPQQTPAALPLGAGGDPNPYPGSLDDTSRKHGRTDSNDYDPDHGRKGGFKKKKGDQSKPYNYKTQVCSFWEQGKCLKGDACTYRHGNEDA
ncbi:hypothetical protein EDD37DRAFT_133025 [Exophiala viscosa]|uniref:C3H1-type domain-containing protein n=1 Tax=Exophiala viscosa TaxID=2486360 RepID=A0AAN6I997_9EURO|nr:hypothetical protein EDD36DRAFT_80611 [Exophiala viscosa]KAI1620788.1 hypothetical protein EDD37DRAFT_133025 [Exophiala viscosa]